MTTRGWWMAGALVAVAFAASPGPGTAYGDDPPPSDPPADPPAPSSPESPPEPDAVPAALDVRIREAIQKGVTWLRGRGTQDGWFGDTYQRNQPTYNGTKNGYVFPYGPTALAAYTLLKRGVPADDVAVKRAFAWLQKRDRSGGTSYEIAAKLLAVTATADPFKRHKDTAAAGDRVRLIGEERKWAEELTAALLAQRVEPGGWRYRGRGDATKPGPHDLSSTQFAVLALFAAERCGIKIDPTVWAGAIAFARAQQEAEGPENPRAVVDRSRKPPDPPPGGDPGGTSAKPPPDADPKDHARGFAYLLGKGRADEASASGAMTACGIGTIMMSRFSLVSRYPKAWAKVDAAAVQTSVYDGLAWLDLHWDPFKNPPDGGMNLYYVYCVERSMDLIGAQRLGARFWYAEMAEQVLSRQKENGMWTGGNSPNGSPDVLDTCFALLYLHRSTLGGIPFPSVTGGSEEPPSDNR